MWKLLPLSKENIQWLFLVDKLSPHNSLFFVSSVINCGFIWTLLILEYPLPNSCLKKNVWQKNSSTQVKYSEMHDIYQSI